MFTAEVVNLIRDSFFKRLGKKPVWEKNDVKVAFEAAVFDGLSANLKDIEGKEKVKSGV